MAAASKRIPTILDIPSSPGSDIAEPELSPESKKILEKFTVPAAQCEPVTDVKSKPSLILRPKSSGILAAGGFQFAKPARPASKFSLRRPHKEAISPRTGTPSKNQTDTSITNETTASPIKKQQRVCFGQDTTNEVSQSGKKNLEKDHGPVQDKEVEGKQSKINIADISSPHDTIKDNEQWDPSSHDDKNKCQSSFNSSTEAVGCYASEKHQACSKSDDKNTEGPTELFVTPHPSRCDVMPSTSGPSIGTDESTFAEDTQLTSPCQSPVDTPSKKMQPNKTSEVSNKLAPRIIEESPKRPETSGLLVKKAGNKREPNAQPKEALSEPAMLQPTTVPEPESVPIARSLSNVRPSSQEQPLNIFPRPVLATQVQKPLGFPMASRVMKRPMAPSQSRPLSSASSRAAITASRRQAPFEQKLDNRNPSEEDLFMMLIARLKKREEMETVNRAAKERLQKEFMEASQENHRLGQELKRAEERQIQQEEQLREQQEMVEKWKTKFGRLKELANDVGSSFEELKTHGKQLKETQDLLLGTKNELQQDMQQIHDGNKKSQKCWERYISNISDVKKSVIEMETAVAVAKTEARERDRAIREERCRVAKLENHIRTYCIRQLKDTTALQNMESDLMTRVRTLSLTVESLRDDASGMSRTMGKDIELTLELLRSLTECDLVKPADIAMVQNAIEEKWFQLKSSVENSLNNLGNSLSIHTSQGDNITTKLARIEESIASIFESANILSKAQDTHNALQAKLNDTQKSLSDLTQEREQLRSREQALRMQVERMTAEVERLQKQSIEAAETRLADVSSEMQRQLEASQTALHEALAQARLKESALQANQKQIEEANRRASDAKEVAAALQKEKEELEAKASQIELNIRQELTRASLAAKEQNKAWLEQEKHKLNREKQQSEKVLEAMKQQLEITRASLEKANGMYEAAAAKEKELKKQHDDLKRSSTANERELQSKIKKLENAHKASSKKLDTSQQEEQRIRKEFEVLKAQLESDEGPNVLKQKIAELEGAMEKKTNLISSLQNQLGQFQDLEGETTNLRKNLDDKVSEIDSLKKQVEQMTASVDAAESLLRLKDSEISDLLSKLSLADKERDTLHDFQTLADEKQRELESVRSQKMQSDVLITKAEASFHQLGLLAPGQALLTSWDALQSHLEELVQRPKNSFTTDVEPTKNKPAGKRKRSAPHVDILPGTGQCDTSTREAKYQTCHIQESGPSSVKKVTRPRRLIERKKARQMQAPPIKSFCQIQDEVPAKLAPGTPVASKDFDALLFSTPAEPQTQTQPQQQQQQPGKNDDTQSTRKSTSEKMLLDEIEARQSQSGESDSKQTRDQLPRPESNGSTRIPETQLQSTVSQQPPSQLMPAKGILKETSSVLITQTPRTIRTPSNKITGNSSAIEMAVNGAFRRPSRMASKFFDPLPITNEVPVATAAQSQVALADDVMPTRALRKTRGRYSRKRGNYNDRFLRELKG